MVTKGLINGVKLADVEHCAKAINMGMGNNTNCHITVANEDLRNQEYIKFCKNKFGYKTVSLRADNGTEFVNSEFKRFLMDKGIQLKTSAPYCHEQNGAAEREIRTIVKSARSMLYTKDLPLYLWAEAVNMGRSRRKPVLNHLKVFGSEVFMDIPDNLRKKLEPKGRKLILVGYDNDSTNYRLFDIVTKKIKISRNVTFNEDNEVTIPGVNQIIVPVNDEIVENVDQETIIKVEQEDENRRNETR
ncbi:hypothetical protein QE152_g16906 [Popillia japonica]|uniref:Integrase catalytic domain-containing protein n=1 Tax=Popillia japonica TaxID=7064 RepID=A0AAW1L633_POPJA